jgi:hypothetical protein
MVDFLKEVANVLTALGVIVVAVLAWLERRNAASRFNTQQKKLTEVAVEVAEVKHATNSLTDRLVEQKGIAEFARGTAEEKERADVAKRAAGGTP